MYVHIYIKHNKANLHQSFIAMSLGWHVVSGKATSELCRSSQLNANKMF